MSDKAKFRCPHPECGAVLRIRASVPDGEYDCICKHCRIKLTWITYVDGGRKPSLRLVEKQT